MKYWNFENFNTKKDLCVFIIYFVLCRPEADSNGEEGFTKKV
jgi:hypothetical protein